MAAGIKKLSWRAVKAVNRELKRSVACTIGDYIDKGGQAVVYGLKDSARNLTEYIVRIVKISDDNAEYVAREIEAYEWLKRNEAPNFVPCIREVRVTDGRADNQYSCMIMPRMCSLKKYIPEGDDPYRDDTEISCRIGVDLLPLLAACRRRNSPLLHRDIKPANIFFKDDFRKNCFRLSDWGIVTSNDGTLGSEDKEKARARRLEEGVTQVGSPGAVSPEVAAGEDDIHLCDIYSLGATMYYFLNNRKYPAPVENKRMPAHGSEKLKNIVMKATEIDPNNRYQSPEEMLAALETTEEYQLLVLEPENEPEFFEVEYEPSFGEEPEEKAEEEPVQAEEKTEAEAPARAQEYEPPTRIYNGKISAKPPRRYPCYADTVVTFRI